MYCTRGFTLIEILVAIAILAILATLAVPQINDVFAGIEAKKVESNLRTLITQTKQHAYIYRKRVGICGSTDGSTCNSQGWSNTILVFNDQQIKNRTRDPQEDIIQRVTLDLKYGTLQWQGARTKDLIFHADSGLPRGSNGTFHYCSHYQDKHFNLLMSDMGHLRLEKQKTC